LFDRGVLVGILGIIRKTLLNYFGRPVLDGKNPKRPF
jgi:hypothetical protein